ncbi:hypothetical protein ABI59_14105 [Acidobacteria bacterium Mor1]|nr:hypothetical protein ABI59_14105 [Acidobacteria bacterium Mor1]
MIKSSIAAKSAHARKATLARFLLIGLVAVALALPAAAGRDDSPRSKGGREVDLTHDMAPRGEVSLEVVSGDITVIGWDRSEMRISGWVGPGVDDIEIDKNDGDIDISVDLHSGSHRNNRANVDLTIHVPNNADLDLECVSARIEVDGVGGVINIENVSGRIDVGDSFRELNVESVSGKVVARSTTAPRDVSIEAVSGTMELDLALNDRSSITLESVSGTVTLSLDKNVSADFDIETFSGSIRNGLGGPQARREKFGPGQSLEFSHNGGGASVEIDVFSGSVRLEKR